MRKAERSVSKHAHPPTSLAFIGQVTKHTTVTWPIARALIRLLICYMTEKFANARALIFAEAQNNN